MRTREIVLRQRLEVAPQLADFELIARELPDVPKCGTLLVRFVYLSLDPYLGQALCGRHMGEPHPGTGESLPGYAIGQVIASGDRRFVPGDHVVGQGGWAEFGIVAADAARKVDPALGLTVHLGILGIPGLTAWAAVTQLLKVHGNDVFTVDAAAGPVGGTAGQVARLFGARAVGIAGGSIKCALVRDAYHFDDCIDYRGPDWPDALANATGRGPTAHLENVGLSVLSPVMTILRDYGRVALCGLAEHYHDGGPRPAIPIGTIMLKRALMMGLIVYDFVPRWGEWIAFARPHLEAGRLVEHNDVVEGLHSAPEQFGKLLAGRNLGKTLVKLS
jgi:NADPH-dependent curcumin reductase